MGDKTSEDPPISREEVQKELEQLEKRLGGRIELNQIRQEMNRQAIRNLGSKVKQGAADAGVGTAKLALLVGMAVVSPKDMLNKLYNKLDAGAASEDDGEADDDDA